MNAFIVTIKGAPSLDELDAALAAIVADPETRRELRVLIDVQNPVAPTADEGNAALARLGRYLPMSDQIEVFVVVARSGHRPPGRVAAVSFGERVTIDIFNEMAAAVTALTMEGLD